MKGSGDVPLIVVLGSLHHDVMIDAPRRPVTGETLAGSRWYPKFGGKGGNQAMAAARAGADVRLVGAVGRDGFGDYLRQALADACVPVDRIGIVEDHGTGMSVAIVDAEGDYSAVIVSGANAHIDSQQFADEALWQGADMLLLQNEVPEMLNVQAARQARTRGIPVCLNAAPSRVFAHGLDELVDILVVNAIEAEDLCEVPVDSLRSASAAAVCLATRFESVVVTAGGNGVAIASRHVGSQAVPPVPVKVVSTHGAGDLFTGVFCVALAEGADTHTAALRANEAAAMQVSGRQFGG